jgi:DNA (cytosine-5)-methyltransferase 1
VAGKHVHEGPTCLDLFCGIGGLTIGLEQAGIRSLGGIDCWEDAKATFDHNLAPLRCMLGDLTKISTHQMGESFGIDPLEIDVIAGGPPCQGFSTVGKRDASDPRNDLWSAFGNVVAAIRPAYVVIENVEGLVVMEKGKVRDAIIARFAEMGYRLECRLLRAADYGVPQLRKRTVFLGWLEGLRPVEFPPLLREEYVSVADAIFDLPPLRASESADRYFGVPLTPYQQARRKDVTVLTNHEAANHPPELVEILSHVPDGGNRKSIPERLQPKSGFHNSYSRLASWKPAVAVTSNMRKPSSARATHPTQHRGLTVREGLRLQSFDDDFVVLGSRTSQYLQVGNAVPPLLGKALGAAVLRAFRANDPEAIRVVRRAWSNRRFPPLPGPAPDPLSDNTNVAALEKPPCQDRE